MTALAARIEALCDQPALLEAYGQKWVRVLRIRAVLAESADEDAAHDNAIRAQALRDAADDWRDIRWNPRLNPKVTAEWLDLRADELDPKENNR